ncbi:unnamed protein product [Allacma fusca]|uniref:Uncharacterized protein n=1 Tax=Allacma fusca TaxID=39272 RepID=A0A8J2KQ62_9HEXA|nr:unnamed protein product [Allacma fusca]
METLKYTRPAGIPEAIHVVLCLILVQLFMATAPLPSFNPETRVGHYLPKSEIERCQLSTSTKAVFQPNPLDLFSYRPSILLNDCLFHVRTWYQPTSKRPATKPEDLQLMPPYNHMWLRKRQTRRIPIYHPVNKDVSEEDY